MPELPWEMIARSQRAAAGLLADTVSSLVEMGKAGVTRPEEVLAQVSALAAAMGDLAGSTARPLEFFLESQRQLAETMSAFAVLQRQLADVLETAASNHAAIVQALEMMSNPVIGVAQRVRTETRGASAAQPEPDAGEPSSSTTATGGRTSRSAGSGKSTKSSTSTRTGKTASSKPRSSRKRKSSD